MFFKEVLLKFHSKALVLKSSFNKTAGLQANLTSGLVPVNTN